MSEQTGPDTSQQSSSSWVLVVLFWTYVLVPLGWGVYRTLLNVASLFTG
ncbi:Hypothetical Protein RradSPS_2578 [Rubrobacter radiotolerans]|uniref:Oxalate:formate antiporter n=1 Tax=Rubrobacter radiotolerans TaxID=42256 RepID=A0A023X6K8_RUBRA|nr:oxalate:formate antiporter [Rubrobacter radiotolerans]AHY47861.1 Hypothetical Protein RradSPS_2578 [Rubrobacter radiotolerans]MDX5892500.1 hypothetical protein [Rubrobacter radiotolerans]SMC07791.1 hypothetical protein SAMN00767673_2651 [Rubrobacter radiotolerans DSM 5868]